MMQLVKLHTGDAGLVVNGIPVMTAEPGLDDPHHVELVAERLAMALGEGLQVMDLQAPEGDWTWEDIAQHLDVAAACQG